eukprot:gene3317-631_t
MAPPFLPRELSQGCAKIGSMCVHWFIILMAMVVGALLFLCFLLIILISRYRINYSFAPAEDIKLRADQKHLLERLLRDRDGDDTTTLTSSESSGDRPQGSLLLDPFFYIFGHEINTAQFSQNTVQGRKQASGAGSFPRVDACIAPQSLESWPRPLGLHNNSAVHAMRQIRLQPGYGPSPGAPGALQSGTGLEAGADTGISQTSESGNKAPIAEDHGTPVPIHSEKNHISGIWTQMDPEFEQADLFSGWKPWGNSLE